MKFPDCFIPELTNASCKHLASLIVEQMSESELRYEMQVRIEDEYKEHLDIFEGEWFDHGEEMWNWSRDQIKHDRTVEILQRYMAPASAEVIAREIESIGCTA